MLFTHSLEARSLRSKCQHGQLLMRGFLLNCRWPPSHFPGSSAGKESSCNAEDPSSLPRSGRSPGEGIGYPLQYSWASLVAQIVKNPPAMWETWVWSLGWEDPLEEGMATQSSILAWRTAMDRAAWRGTVHGIMTDQPSTAQYSTFSLCVHMTLSLCELMDRESPLLSLPIKTLIPW